MDMRYRLITLYCLLSVQDVNHDDMLAHKNEQTVEQSVEGHNTFPSPRKTSSIDIMWYCLQGSSMVTL